MSFRLTPAAEADLAEIVAYVAEQASPDRADGVLGAVFRAADLLGEAPRIGHRRPDLTKEPVLFWPVHSLLLAYLPDEDPVVIVRVVHGSRDPTALADLLGEDA